jgi:hypothetical protein
MTSCPVNSVAGIRKPDKFSTLSTANILHLQVLHIKTGMRPCIIQLIENEILCHQMESPRTLDLLFSLPMPVCELIALLHFN